MEVTKVLGPVHTVPSGASLADVSRLMAGTGLRAVVVTDHHRQAVGIVTERDLVVRALAWDLPADTPIDAVMTPELVTADPSSSARSVYRLLRSHGIRQVPLVDDGRVVAVVSLDDLADEADADIIASLRHCPRCGRGWLRPVSTSDKTNFLCMLCRSCWHLQAGELVAVETRSCRGCPEHNFCRFPLIDYGVDSRRLPGNGPTVVGPRSHPIRDVGLCAVHPVATDDEDEAPGRDQEGDPPTEGATQ